MNSRIVSAFRIVAFVEALTWLGLMIGMYFKWIAETGEAGVKIFEARDVILHAKSVTIDGVWSSIGSSNLDRRSVLFNDEVDVIVLGGTSGARMEAIFDDDFKEADRIDAEACSKRSLSERFDELAARLLWEYWL